MTQNPQPEFFTIDDILPLVQHAWRDVEIAGKPTRIRPATVLENIAIIKRLPKALALFEAVLKDGEDDPFAARSLVDLFTDAGPEAAAALIATCFGRPGDYTVEAGIAAAPDDFLVPALGHSISVTLGDRSPEEYFFTLAEMLAKTGAIKVRDDKKPARTAPVAANRTARRKASAVAKAA